MRKLWLVAVVFVACLVDSVFGGGHGKNGGSNPGWSFNVNPEAILWGVIGITVLVGAYFLLKKYVVE